MKADEAQALPTVVVRGMQTGIAKYRANKSVAPKLVALLHTGLTRLLAEHGAIELHCAGQFIVLAGETLPRGDEDRTYTRRLLRVLRHCGLKGLRIEPGLGVGELQTVLEILGLASRPGELLSEVAGRLRRARVVHVSALEATQELALRFPGGMGFSLHRADAQRLYREGLRLVLALNDAARSRTMMPWLLMRRWVQRLVDLLDEDPTPLLGLTQIKSMEDYEVTHAVNVTILSLALARASELDKREVQNVGLAALVHDVGQTEIPTEVLTRQGALSDDEWAQMRRHSLHTAARLLDSGPLEFAAPAALAALQHHVGMTGDGYPSLPEDIEISTTARIVHIADTYDALTSRRVYRLHPVRPDQALMFLVENAGTMFDTAWVRRFVRTLGFYPPGTTVQLDTDEIGVVVRPNDRPRMSHRPQVCLMLDADGRPLENEAIVDLAETSVGTSEYTRTVTKSVDPAALEIAPAALFLGND